MKGFRILGSVVLFLAILGLFLWTSSGVKAGDEIKAGEEVKAAEGVKAAEAAFTYIGSEKCKMCHKGETKGAIFEKWLETPHAKAFENLPAASQKDEKCLVCHTTAFGAGGYVVGAEGAEAFAGVGCE
ncbi:MAG: cytochrome c family protein, partial [Candidatus Eisenbacteria bacterium]|nr:cytochrome c family protein [Candidatus Eisenbacteria bacterium]